MVLKVLARGIKQEREIKVSTQEKKKQTSLLTDEIILYMENPNLHIKVFELTN